VIEDNTSITNLQSDVFLFKASISGSVTQAGSGGRPGQQAQGAAGVTVELEDGSGNVLATTVTDTRGNYRFNQQNGVSATGIYTVMIMVPSGDTQTSANPAPITISRGDINVTGVNFTLAGPGSQPWTPWQDSGTTTSSASSSTASTAGLDSVFADPIFWGGGKHGS
jgi:hypothetical protein